MLTTVVLCWVDIDLRPAEFKSYLPWDQLCTGSPVTQPVSMFAHRTIDKGLSVWSKVDLT